MSANKLLTSVAPPQVLYVKGYCPDPAVVRQLCPHLETLHCPEHLESACMQYGIKNVNLVLEGTRCHKNTPFVKLLAAIVGLDIFRVY
eukprot:m.389577 g.389577  ORF g.389577 m.389577 type:complete len:88 (+) comp21052_c0_seq9:380-643(+)